MSGYNGRRGPNVSQYVANLNTIPSHLDLLEEPVDIESDLALFTNSEFIDWNAGEFDPSQTLPSFDLEAEQRARRLNASGAKKFNNNTTEPNMGFNINDDFQFADFSGFQNPIVDQSMQNLPHSQANTYSVPRSYASPVSASVSPVTSQFDQPTGKKRKLDNVDPNSQHSIDEAARIAAEEDKRRRNTAASARFRVKKKQREQALEKTAKEMSERVSVLETRIQQLETENTWLKGLITEKNGGKTPASDINAMIKKQIEDNAGERSTGKNTDGVGTESKNSKAKA
ncbi:hypothetical protein K469DRAFT_666714 [Zopfia rhizophila CBS 207.26]|uniref:BZIP domain-containing protein n=1 Tax=Zopfia rhizophila CBS 207.26 TaxID=1314779 RepID=A0A6A6DXL7_9PEZI|nr:hypothetical protein K469DRAFT_666714 [Zopfia rhizophila CBS 207.26]